MKKPITKKSITATIDIKLVGKIEKLAKTDKRSRSSMINILLEAALALED